MPLEEEYLSFQTEAQRLGDLIDSLRPHIAEMTGEQRIRWERIITAFENVKNGMSQDATIASAHAYQEAVTNALVLYKEMVED